MKKIVTDKQKKEINDYLKKWQTLLFLNEWKFELFYHNDPKDECLEITMQAEYKNAFLEINTETLFEKIKDKKEREEAIVHELCHILIEPLVWLTNQAAEGRKITGKEFRRCEESVTQHVTRAIFYQKNV